MSTEDAATIIEPNLGDQAILAQLGLWDLRQRWAKQPPGSTLLFGSGYAEEQTIAGFPEEAFHGVAILNRSGRNIRVGFQTKGAIGSPLIVPAGNLLVWAAEFQNISLSGTSSGPEEPVYVLCLPYPPAQPGIFPLAALRASTTNNQPVDFTVKEASVNLLAANALRVGMEIVNKGAKAVRLMLGAKAEAKHGLWLSGSGGTWNGQLSGATWLGEVNAICDEGETTVAVVEA